MFQIQKSAKLVSFDEELLLIIIFFLFGMYIFISDGNINFR